MPSSSRSGPTSCACKRRSPTSCRPRSRGFTWRMPRRATAQAGGLLPPQHLHGARVPHAVAEEVAARPRAQARRRAHARRAAARHRPQPRVHRRELPRRAADGAQLAAPQADPRGAPRAWPRREPADPSWWATTTTRCSRRASARRSARPVLPELSDARTYTRYKFFRGHYDFATSVGFDIDDIKTLPQGRSDHLPILASMTLKVSWAA